MKLLCLPCAGASATMYYRWQSLTPDWLQVVPLELAGRGERIAQPHITSFSGQLDDIMATHGSQFTGDYVLFGHSMGGLLAYALTHRLTLAHKTMPHAVVVSASSPPVVNATGSERYVTLDDDALIADLKQQNGTPAAVFEHKELLEMVIGNLRADYQVCADYEHDDGLQTTLPIHVMAGKKDRIDPEKMAVWQSLTTAKTTTDWFDGDHFYIQQNQCEAEFLANLVRRVDNYQRVA